jgi:hypothetical protein
VKIAIVSDLPWAFPLGGAAAPALIYGHARGRKPAGGRHGPHPDPATTR